MTQGEEMAPKVTDTQAGTEIQTAACVCVSPSRIKKLLASSPVPQKEIQAPCSIPVTAAFSTHHTVKVNFSQISHMGPAKFILKI